MKINVFWFRRDLRLDDNTALNNAYMSGLPVLPVFIFDTNITDELSSDDPRITFIYDSLTSIDIELKYAGSSVLILRGDPVKIWEKLVASYDIKTVFFNKDYEPYAIQRDSAVENLLRLNHIPLLKFKDQVIFEEREVLKSDNTPYTIFTPFKKCWLQKLVSTKPQKTFSTTKKTPEYYKSNFILPSLNDLGFRESSVKVRSFDLSVIREYEKYRDFPFADKTSYLSPHLRFGTVSIRDIVNIALTENQVFLSELIWREFFMQILFNFPNVVSGNFKKKYDYLPWRNNEKEYERWCTGETGYPLVDAGMRQLNKTGYMHNRVRMITAGFLCKHLLIDWRWGEAYFAQKLLDNDLSSNNGNWQWAAGTGCDAAPWFRVFNPDTQQKKFDLKKDYIRKWIEDFDKPYYPKPIVDHDYARKRAISAYKSGLNFHETFLTI